MSRYVLDTSAYSYFQRGDPRVIDLIDSATWLGITPIVLGELETGFLLGNADRLEENRTGLSAFMANPVVEELRLSSRSSRLYGEILVTLRQAGTKIPTNDIWIAASAAQVGASVLTYDNHFSAIQRISATILAIPASRN